MLSPLTWLLLALGAFTIFYVVARWRGAGQAAHDKTSEPEVVEPGMPSGGQLGLGFVTNFFDTLGIGSFAPTTSAFKFFKMVPDRLIPGTLNVGHTLPTITEAFIYTAVIAVDAEHADFHDRRGGRSAPGSAPASSRAGRSAPCRSGWASRCIVRGVALHV